VRDREAGLDVAVPTDASSGTLRLLIVRATPDQVRAILGAMGRIARTAAVALLTV